MALSHTPGTGNGAGCSAFCKGRGLSTSLSNGGRIDFPASEVVGNQGVRSQEKNDSFEGPCVSNPDRYGLWQAAKGVRRTKALSGFRAAAKEQGAKRCANGLVIASYLAVRKSGRLVQLSLPGGNLEPPVRGDVEGFSASSQRRLLRLLHSIERNVELPVMVTLTFPSELTVSPDEARMCRKAWEKRMERSYGAKWCAVWRLEAHPEMSRRLGRVHPHFHLLTWGAFYDFAEVSRSWQETVFSVLKVDSHLRDAQGHLVAEKHLRAGTNCERVRKWEGVVYCTKSYLAKEEDYPLGKAGRVWGWFNRKALPIAEETRIPLTHLQASFVRARVELWMREKNIKSDHLVCTFFDSNPVGFVAWLTDGMPGASPQGRMPERRKI